jgi:hypothetical protein
VEEALVRRRLDGHRAISLGRVSREVSPAGTRRVSSRHYQRYALG